MKDFVLEPKFSDENIIVQFSEKIITDKKISVHVPNGYQAIVFIDEKIISRIEPCMSKKMSDYGKEYLNRNCRIAFVRSKAIPEILWGFGNIQVNNERLKEAYRVGANGTYSVEIAEIAKLVNALEFGMDITTEKIREKTVAILKNIGTSVLGSFFANTKTSIFEAASLTGELRKSMIDALKDEIAFSELGIKLKDLTVDGIHANEKDLELIRNRINT
ncbi:MAG: hypothetical protein E7633_03170 [Ruminococcaceae bacterium]|nr:hypothetical protein [Oscillospiraceae bacterium]